MSSYHNITGGNMRKFELQFKEGEVEAKLHELSTSLADEDNLLIFIGILNEEEKEILAKLHICNDRLKTFCKSCDIMCEFCPLDHMHRTITDLRNLLENNIKYRLNVWPRGVMSYHKGFIVQLNELTVKLDCSTTANFNEPSLPREGTNEYKLINSIFSGKDALKFLSEKYKKSRA